jgi:hypothetical protein
VDAFKAVFLPDVYSKTVPGSEIAKDKSALLVPIPIPMFRWGCGLLVRRYNDFYYFHVKSILQDKASHCLFRNRRYPRRMCRILNSSAGRPQPSPA